MAAPAVEPYKYGLFSVAQMPAAESDPHWQCGVTYEPFSCDKSSAVGDYCPTPPALVPGPKTVPEGVDQVNGLPFTVYDGFNCSIVGRSEADIMERARQALALGERRAVEEAYWTGAVGNRPRLADPSAVVLNAVPAPTAADALTPVAGIAALENYLASNYGGTGIIHGPRGVSALLARYHLAFAEGTVLRTLVGTPVALGGGYTVNTGPDGVEAPPGTAWLYATGNVVIRRSEVWVNPDSVAQALNRTSNNVTLLAERTYVVTHECLLAAVLININC